MTKIKILTDAIECYKLDFKNYPTEAEGLKVLIVKQKNKHYNGPYLNSKELPLDSWGTPYRYRLVSDKPLIESAGSDTIFGTKDDLKITEASNK